MSSAAWKIEDQFARLSTPTLCGAIQLAQPARGLHELTWQQVALGAATLLGVQLPTTVSGENAVLDDAYIRGDDLVATYRQTPDKPARVQVYWRWRERAVALHAAVDVEISVQTSLLDSQPEMRLQTHFPGQELLRLTDPLASRFDSLELASASNTSYKADTGTGCWLWRPRNEEWSYAEMMHPSDFWQDHVATKVDRAPTVVEVSHQLFPERLEKGVIRRARARGIFVTRERDEQTVVDAYQQFAREEPPLTT